MINCKFPLTWHRWQRRFLVCWRVQYHAEDCSVQSVTSKNLACSLFTPCL